MDSVVSALISHLSHLFHDPYFAPGFALRYYRDNKRFGTMGYWYTELDQLNSCYQNVCFGTVTHGFAPDERPLPPPIVAAP